MSFEQSEVPYVLGIDLPRHGEPESLCLTQAQARSEALVSPSLVDLSSVLPNSVLFNPVLDDYGRAFHRRFIRVH